MEAAPVSDINSHVAFYSTTSPQNPKRRSSGMITAILPWALVERRSKEATTSGTGCRMELMQIGSFLVQVDIFMV
jgi:hypothetical protein